MTSFQCEPPTASWGIPEVRKFARQMVGEYVHALCRLTSKERAQVGDMQGHDRACGLWLQLANLPNGADDLLRELLARLDQLGAEMERSEDTAPRPTPRLVWTAP